ncbi:MAG: hypothetical protein M0P99_01485 [Candidatus Cloacimonetes bacterium]|nr:hypothetical protein [Candidatus Cloacimonadota bacterium]
MKADLLLKLSVCLLLCLLILSGCNRRENPLLPPNLSAADYLSGNKIESYANYLVKSANDNSYLLIDKTAIADSLLDYGDVIKFRKVQSFATRDSLALQDGATSLGETYEMAVMRAGQRVDLVSRIPLGQVYTELKPSDSPYFVNYANFLQACPIQPIFYGSSRAYFPLFGTGEFSIYDIPATDDPQLSKTTSGVLHALLQDGSANQLSLNFPAAYCQAAGQINLSMGSPLNQAELGTLQGLYPNAAISTPVISLQTATPTGSETAQLRLKNSSKGFFGQQWLRLASPMAYSWPATNLSSQATNWKMDNTGLYSFVQGSGKYFLLNPLESQTELNIPLDGSYNQVFLQELWFDLQNINLPNTVMNLKLNPDVSTSLNDYFSGQPFTLNGGHQAFAISFAESGTALKTLPNDAWLEFGFRTTLPQTANDRLFNLYRNSSEDVITFKSPSDSYDATHYSRVGDYVYLGINGSATYLYGSISEPQTQLNFPYLKSKQYIQSSHGVVSWNDSGKRGYSHLRLNLSPALPSHPWLSGEPLSLSSAQAVANFAFYQGSSEQSTLPTGFNLSVPYSGTSVKLLLFNNLLYPRVKLYHAATAYESDTYLIVGGLLSIYPEYPGTLIAANISYPNPMNLRVFSTMTFVLDELRFYTYGNAPAGQSAVFSINKMASLADPYDVLSTQYTLTASSPAYEINTADEAGYNIYQPTLFFKRSRSRNLLFYERVSNPYRLYAYHESSSFDPWHFMVDNGYNGISLAYNGSYASYTEISTHSSVIYTVNSLSQDVHLSLYQAQFVLPSFFFGGAVPQATKIKLEQLSSIPGITNLLAAYQLQFTLANSSTLYPDFYNVIGATQEPYIYLPISDIAAIPTARLFYRDFSGQISELTRVESFGDNYADEYTVVGNCFICTVSNPGIFYISAD